ncbi:hypothetical protein THAOC_11886, partial [Thalassiosira oceanica]
EGLPAAGEAESAPQAEAEPTTAAGGPGEARDDKTGTAAEDCAAGDGGGGPSDDAARGPTAGEAAGQDGEMCVVQIQSRSLTDESQLNQRTDPS